MLEALGFEAGNIQTAAVCVYPAKVPIAVATLKKMGMENKINVASGTTDKTIQLQGTNLGSSTDWLYHSFLSFAVATGFPSGQYPLETRLAEIRWAVDKGANEIDIVIDRSLVINKLWVDLYQEIQKMKEACGNAHLKTILAVGELGSFDNVYKASLVAMMAGSDFIKTSTGQTLTDLKFLSLSLHLLKTDSSLFLNRKRGSKCYNPCWNCYVSSYQGLLDKNWLSSKYKFYYESGLHIYLTNLFTIVLNITRLDSNQLEEFALLLTPLPGLS